MPGAVREKEEEGKAMFKLAKLQSLQGVNGRRALGLLIDMLCIKEWASRNGILGWGRQVGSHAYPSECDSFRGLSSILREELTF